MVETLIERLRNADTNSQQRVLGSRIFGEAADRLEALERQNAELRKELDHWKTEALGDRQKVERRDRQLAERDADLARVRVALEDACDQILDSYRTWVADHITAFPRPGQIPRYDRARAALAGSGDGWRLVPVEFIEFVKNAPVSSGTCCCGEDMENHANPMSCGHSPVDEWDYSLSKWLKQISASPSTAGER